ncbi:MAG: nuclease-related domain-containing protein [Candidatus Limnocylindrales bacterium]
MALPSRFRSLGHTASRSKHFAEGVSINDHGEWTGFSGGRPYGMASPIEQNRRHVAALEQAFATGLVQLPKRLGMVPIKPWIRSLVLG